MEAGGTLARQKPPPDLQQTQRNNQRKQTMKHRPNTSCQRILKTLQTLHPPEHQDARKAKGFDFIQRQETGS